MTLLSRISGLVRDMLFASLIGAGTGVAADAFYVAFRIPNFLRRIFGEGAFSQSFVPVFAEYKAKYTAAETRAFVDHMAGICGAILFGVTLIGVLRRAHRGHGPGAGFSRRAAQIRPDGADAAHHFSLSFLHLAGGDGGGHSQYLRPFRRGRLYAGAAQPEHDRRRRVARPAHGRAGAGAGLGCVHRRRGAVAVPDSVPARLKMLPRPRLHVRERHHGVMRVFRLMLPAIFGVSVAQINMLVNTLLASFLVTGSVSWLYYSDRLMEFPLGVFGIALATVILPSLSRRHARNSHDEFSHLLDWALALGFPDRGSGLRGADDSFGAAADHVFSLRRVRRQ